MAASIAETLFIREAELLEAAVNYADWTRDNTGGAQTDRAAAVASRRRLRAAAVAYAEVAEDIG